MKFLTRISPFVLAFMPVVAFAQFGGIDIFFFRVLSFINGILVPFVFAIAFLIFIWGVFKYFIKGGAEPGEQEKGKQLMVYGIAGFVLMVTIWGIVNLLARGLGFGNTQQLYNIPHTPTFRSTTGSGSGSGSGTQFPSGNVPVPTPKPPAPDRPGSGGSEVINI